MKNSDRVWEIFDKSFYELRSHKIAIYGIGDYTKIISNKASNYNIIGLLDGCKNEGIMYQLPILDISKLAEGDIEIVIIIARASNVKIIFRRIETICRNLGIRVFDINGKDLLLKKTEDIRNEKYYDLSEEDLINRIDKVDIVSFDIFDTLIMRKVLYPTDIFELMEIRYSDMPKDFAKKRVVTERILNMKKNVPSIYDIYNNLRIQYGWNDNEMNKYLKLEFKTDCDSIIHREAIFLIFQYCIENKKTVYLISDMYYTREMLVDLLEGLGIKGYKDILISSEFRTSKSDRLFEKYLEFEPNKKKLHIGDDEEADWYAPNNYNIESFLIKSARDMLEISTYEEIFNIIDSPLDRLVLGCFVATVFNNPFELYNSNGKGKINTYGEQGYCFLAPIIVHFVIWLIDSFKKKDYDLIIFASRDGFIVKQIYDYFVVNRKSELKSTEAIYLYASRIAYTAMSIFNDEDIKFVYSLAFDSTPEDMLYQRFRLDKDSIEPYDSTLFSSEEEYIIYHREAILEKSKDLRNKFFKYWNNSGLLKKSNIAFFDFVSSGTCQRCLQNVIDTPIEGYYYSFIKNGTSENVIKVNSLYNSDYGFENSYFISSNYLFMENILSSYEPTLKEFDLEGKPVFMNENRTKNQIEDLKAIHDAIMEYAKDIMALLNGNINCNFTKNVADKLLEFMQNMYTELDFNIRNDEVLIDEFCRRKIDISNIYE